MNKTEAVSKILAIMDAEKVSVAEISAAMRARLYPKPDETYDLLVEVFGEKKRVAFESGKNMSPIAIFPRKDLKFYIELDETPMTEFPSEEEKSNFMDEEMATLVQGVRDGLNDKLRELGKPILSGDYWLNGHELPGHIGYHIARFRDGRLEADYYDAYHRAKVRRFGRLA